MRLEEKEAAGDGQASSSSLSHDGNHGSLSQLCSLHAVPASSNGLNGNSTVEKTNGSNGHLGIDKTLPYGSLPREEVVRLMVQALTELGYDDTAKSLEKESGFLYELPTISSFKQAILKGDWPLVENTLDILVPAQVNSDDLQVERVTDIHPGQEWVLGDVVAGAKARFLVREQKFLEMLETRNIKSALHVLRKEIAPIADWLDEQENSGALGSADGVNNFDRAVSAFTDQPGNSSTNARKSMKGGTLINATARLHTLSCLLMCHDVSELKSRANWDGKNGNSRHRLLHELSNFIPAAYMIPEGRLQTLIEQSREHQAMLCPWHLSHTHFSLYEDHQCPGTVFPSKTIKVLTAHTDEVWHVAWSRSGKYLATCGKDNTALIWNVASWTVLHTLKDHKHAVTYAEWSPDESILLTCCLDKIVRLWDTKSGTCLSRLEGHKEQVGTAAWLPDGQVVVTGAMDRNLHFWGKNGRIILTWKTCRVIDLAMSQDGKHMVVVGKDGNVGKILFFNLEAEDEVVVNEETDPTCVTISMDGKSALVSMAPGSLHVYDIENGHRTHKYTGQQQDKLIIRSCFGGVGLDTRARSTKSSNAQANVGSDGSTDHTQLSSMPNRKQSIENFLLSGSEDNIIYVWHRESGRLIQTLEGHTASVNSVAWNWGHAFQTSSSPRSVAESPESQFRRNGQRAQLSMATSNGVFASASDDGTVRIWGFPD